MFCKNLFIRAHSRRLLPVALLLGLNGACSGIETDAMRPTMLRRAEVEQLASAMEREVEGHYAVLQHKLVNRYVNALGQSMVARNPDMPTLAYRFKVLRSSDLNAFSLPGGAVYVTLGMLSRLELEAQFAAVLAHELAHQDAGHALILWQQRIGSAHSAAGSGVYRGDDFRSHYFGSKGLLAYGESFEREADEIALTLLYQAGFDPRAYVSLLEELQRIEVRQPNLVADLLSVHPPLAARIKWARDYAKVLPPRRDARITSATFREIKQRLKLAEQAPAAKSGKRKSEGGGSEELKE